MTRVLKNAFATIGCCVGTLFLLPCGCKGSLVVDTEWRSSPPSNSSSIFLSSIPKLIWQTVKSHDDAPQGAFDAMKTWSEKNPAWDRVVLDDDEMVSFVKRFYNETELELFNDLKLSVMKADLFRYMALYLFGGVYVDADTRSLNPLEDWAPAECDFVVACEYDEADTFGWESTTDDFCQWAFAARPRHPALGLLIQMIFETAKSGIDYRYRHFVHEATGPAMFTRALKKFFGIKDEEFGSCESFVKSSRAKEMRREGVCWMTKTEMKNNLLNLYGSIDPEFEGSSWNSWVEEKKRLLRELGAQCDLTCENVDDDIAEIVEQMDDLGYSVFSGSFELVADDAEGAFTLVPGDGDEVFTSDFNERFNGFRLGPQDAIVFRGCSPPPVDYFGVTHSVVSYDLRDFLAGDRPVPASEAGDSINQCRLLAEENDDTSFAFPFDRKINFVMSPDKQTVNDVLTAYDEADLDATSINVLGIPLDLSDRIDPGLGPINPNITNTSLGSVFSLDLRIRGFQEPCDPEVYLNQSFPFRVFYLDYDEDAVPRMPFAIGEAPPRLTRGGEQNENKLRKTQRAVVNAVTKKLRYFGKCLVDINRIRNSRTNRFGYCFRDTDPACDMGSQDFLKGVASVPKANLTTHIVVGAIHTLTGLSEYATIGIQTDNGDTSRTIETKTLAASVHDWDYNKRFRNVDNLDKMFVLQVSSFCSGDDEACVTAIVGTVDYTEFSVLEKETMTGPTYRDILNPVILSFEPCPEHRKPKKKRHGGKHHARN